MNIITYDSRPNSLLLLPSAAMSFKFMRTFSVTFLLKMFLIFSATSAISFRVTNVLTVVVRVLVFAHRTV